METRNHIVLVTIPAFTHQVSILEFAKRLHQDYCFNVTCIIPTISSNINSPNNKNIVSKHFFDSLPPSIQCIFLPPINFEDNEDHVLESQIQVSVSRSMPLVHESLKSISLGTTSNVVALIVDAFAHEALQFAKEFNILSYIYWPCSAMMVSLCLYSSKLDQLVSCEYRDHPKPIEIPGCIPVDGIDLPNSLQERSSVAYKLFLHRCKQFHLVDGILVNSFMELEPNAIKAIASQQDNSTHPTVYPVGPITQTKPKIAQHSNYESCLLWLDNQPPNSVLYVSFGSGGTLSQDQINELALGLELSNHKFLWVNVRVPNNKATATYLSNDVVDPLDFLPQGFVHRTKGQGFVMCGWAPQVEVLEHNSIGAFLTHCGWNSILESIVHGVPMIAWPLFAEQRSNAAMVTEGLKVAMRPKINGKGLVGKEEVAYLVKGLMEGLESEEIRKRVKELQKFAACAIMEDGSSTNTISKLALKWKNLGRRHAIEMIT